MILDINYCVFELDYYTILNFHIVIAYKSNLLNFESDLSINNPDANKWSNIVRRSFGYTINVEDGGSCRYFSSFKIFKLINNSDANE